MAICAALATTNLALADEPSPAAGRLAEYKLEPTTKSLSGYLASLQPTPERRKQLREVIRRLDDPDFARREDAIRELLRQVGGVAPLLAEAIRGDNAEIRWRAKIILEQTDRESRTLLVDMTGVIEIDPQGTVVNRLARGNLSRAWRY